MSLRVLGTKDFIKSPYQANVIYVKSKDVCLELLKSLNIGIKQTFDGTFSNYSIGRKHQKYTDFIAPDNKILATWTESSIKSIDASMLKIHLYVGRDVRYFKENMKLFQAVRVGKIREIQKLVKSGIDINTKDWAGYTPLMRSIQRAEKSSARIIKALLKLGADINAYNDNTSSLKTACGWGYEHTVKLLLENGADPNFTNKDNYSCYQAAKHSFNNEIVNLLIAFGAEAS